MTSRETRRKRAFRAYARNAVRVGKQPVRAHDPRASRADHAAMARKGKKRQAKRRAEIAARVRREIARLKARTGAAARNARAADALHTNLQWQDLGAFFTAIERTEPSDALRALFDLRRAVLAEREKPDNFGARLLRRDGSVPNDVDVDLQIDGKNADAPVNPLKLVTEMTELLRDMRQSMATKTDLAALHADLRSCLRELPAFNCYRGAGARGKSGAGGTIGPTLSLEESTARRWIFRLALFCFGSKADVRRWLAEPGSYAIDHQIPSDMLRTPEGRAKLELFLRRLEAGVYM